MRKMIIRVVVFSLLAFGLIIGTSYLYHHVQLAKETEQFSPPGHMVEVNGHQMHVYTEGEGEEILVFLAGGGTSSPMLDFKSLYSSLSDTYSIAVIEKLGYGFSDVTDSARDIDTLLQESREALRQAGVEGPYVLVPHSMSGLEAMYWATEYPDEVKAIIGLDMAVPEAYDKMNIPMPILHLGAFAANTGLTRWIPGLVPKDAIAQTMLSEKEEELYEFLLYQRTSTKNMINEVAAVKENAKIVQSEAFPDIPMLLFVSNGENTGFEKEDWKQIQNQFLNEVENGEQIKLDAPHYIHHTAYNQIVQEMQQFMKALE